jgi:serine/threonine-protein kinase
MLSRERWQVLEPLLDAALELDAEQRSGFVDSATLDPDLQEELRGLIASCELGESILAMPAAVRFAPLLARECDGMPPILGGRYRIIREIARGGMATVYLAEDPKHARQVAVKAVHRDVARLIGRDRFACEIEIAAGLSHPHILPLHDSGEEPTGDDDGPLLYFVSPYADGESLRARLQRDSRLPPNEVVRLGRQVALALDYAHRRGVIHLDIKPENILLLEGHAVVADFGIARATYDMCDETPAPNLPILGTPSYMSPEQALGLPVDGRSDVYSLGCVLYELLTGVQPFAGTPVLARGDVTPGGEPLEQAGSRELAAVVLRAMAHPREERYATAGELAAALSEAARQTRRRSWRYARAMAVATGALVLAASAGVWAARNNAPLDGDLVAIAPFDVTASSLALWKEGLVDVLSRSLDGAGALRTVSASEVVRSWRGRADAPSALALGRRTGARLVLYGGLMKAGGDTVRASVTLLDVKTGRTVAEFEQRDVGDRMDRLSDSLTVGLLHALGQAHPAGFADAGKWPTMSMAALKAYLHGEQFYRAALWDSAQVSFERALALDSTFALAYHRLAAVRRWRDTRDIPDSSTYALMRWPSRYPHGLGPRERLLATVDSLSAESYFAWRRALHDANYSGEESLVRRLYATLQAGVRRYPTDAELWFLLAEAHKRYDPDVEVGEVDDRATLARYDRAISLDSSFAPAYVTPIALAAYLDGASSARRYIRGYLRLSPSGPQAEIIRVADALLDPSRAPSLEVPRLVDSLPPETLCNASRLLRHVADSAEMAERIGRALLSRPADTSAARRKSMCAEAQIIDALQFRGHLREALRLTGVQLHWMRPAIIYNMSRTGMIPVDTMRAEAAHVLSLAPRTTLEKYYRWWATDGDTAAIQHYIAHFLAAERTLRTASGFEMLQASAGAGRAYLALARHDTATALSRFLTSPDTLHECWYDTRMTLIELLVATGRYSEAAERLARRWPGTTSCSDGFDDVMWTFRRAQVAERRGIRPRAIADYAFVAEAWRTADPELQPYVREAKAGLARASTSNW